MAMAQVLCRNCKRKFSPRSLFQHYSKSLDPDCRSDPVAPQFPLPSAAIPHGAFPLGVAEHLEDSIGSPEPADIMDADVFDDLGGDNFGEITQSDGDDDAHPADLVGQESADAMDADAFEVLTRGTIHSAATSPYRFVGDETTGVSEGPTVQGAAQTVPFDVPNAEMAPTVIIDRFLSGKAGAPIPHVQQGTPAHELDQTMAAESAWAPFNSECDWKFAHWAKTRGPTSTAVTDLLAIDEIVDTLGLSFRTVKQLNEIIDKKLPGHPPFRCKELIIGNECLEFYCRDVVECIRSLYGDPQFAQDLAFAPERHYTSPECTCRIYHEMYTGDWWWTVQESLESYQPGATVIPLIISSDKTQLTHFRDKMAYPVYLTIGNIPKDIRRKPSRHAYILIGYIPTSKLASITNKASCRCAVANLFHGCMRTLLDPIAYIGETGVPMMSADGVWRHCHPILAVFVGDYPEQALVTCTYNGRCPKCEVPPGRLGEHKMFPSHFQSMAIDTYLLADGDACTFHRACRNTGLKPVHHPFWERLPLTDIFLSITPDILHQLLQGMMKHLIRWLIRIFKPGEIDARCRVIPPNHNILLFPKGISTLSRVSGHEHKKMCSILLGLIIGLPVPDGRDSLCIVKSTRALLDFLFLAQYRSHTTASIEHLQDSLTAFHDSKAAFIDLGARKNFNLPKLHSLLHYASSIRLFGMTDNYNTEQSERLHIDLAKNAYRATNHKDEYPQMTVWLEHREKIERHATFIDTRQDLHAQTQRVAGPPCPRTQSVKMARHPSAKAVTFDDLKLRYGTLEFQDTLADFIAEVNNPGARGNALRRYAADTLIPFRQVPVFHIIKFTATGNTEETEIVDSVYARPDQRDKRGRIIPSRFDTVLVQNPSKDTNQGRVKGLQVAQVHAVFHLPNRTVHEVCPSLDTSPATFLAYVEWFSPLVAIPDPAHRMYRVSRLRKDGEPHGGIIPVDWVLRSIHLLPCFGPVVPRQWSSFTVLDQCQTFYVNPFTDIHSYMSFA